MSFRYRVYNLCERFTDWHERNDKQIYTVLICVVVSLAAIGIQEHRITLMRQDYSRKLSNQRDKYQREIIDLQFTLAQEKHNNLPPEERKRREELHRMFEEHDRLDRHRPR